MSSSRSHRHLSDYSRGSSSRSHRALSVTEAVQSLRLTETCGASNPAYPSYASSDRRRHGPSNRDSGYSESLLDVSAYTRTASPASYLEPSPTFDPAVLTVPNYPSYSPTSYPSQPTSDPSSMSYLQTANMSYQSAYPSYRSAATTSARSPSYAGFPDLSPSASLSDSMSGVPVSSILPSSIHKEFEDAARDARQRQRQRTHHKSRRDRKTNLRRESSLRNAASLSSQADDVSASIDSLIAQSHSPQSFGGGSYPSSTSSVHSHYGTATSSKAPPFESLYGYSGSSSSSAYAGYESSRGGYGGYHDRRSANDPPAGGPKAVGPPQEKPRCYDHGCNGREFSTFSNLLRHQREKSGVSLKPVCHRCGAEFTRKTARDGHLAHDKCKMKSPRR